MMANNRMWLVCRGCGTGFMLGKTFSSGYYTSNEDFENNLNTFYDEHAFCGGVDNENMFELQYETAHDDGVKECDYSKMKFFMERRENGRDG